MSADELGYVHRWEPAPAPGAGVPTLLLLHGTGGDENDLVPLGKMLLPNAAMLSPRGNVLERGMPRFFRRFSEGVFDVEDVKLRAAELAAFVGAASKKYGFASDSVIAVGFSNGANIAGAVLLLTPGTLRAAVLFRAQDVLGTAGLGLGLGLGRKSEMGTPVFLAGGESDPIVPREETEKLATRLRESGAKVTLHWEDAVHSIARGDIDAASKWLADLKWGVGNGA